MNYSFTNNLNAMKKITIIIAMVIVSCKVKHIEMPLSKTTDQIVNEAAASSITKELSELDNNIIIARDTARNTIYRNAAINSIRHDAPEYLHTVNIENIFSKDFEEHLQNQKKLIIANCRQVVFNKQYKQLAIEQINK